MPSRTHSNLEVLSSTGGDVAKASFDCLNAPDNVTRIYEGDQEPTIKNTALNPAYTKIFDIPIRNIRGQEHEFELEKQGFQYLKLSPQTYVHPDKDDNIASYLEEVTRLAKEELKADVVICYDYRVLFSLVCFEYRHLYCHDSSERINQNYLKTQYTGSMAGRIGIQYPTNLTLVSI